ncbi:MAG: hypothetical protein KAT90_13705, partial [Gammaproteobacteria bacterium]|nr:hypothetical protein [Gammaproteobacteria bacterium]
MEKQIHEFGNSLTTQITQQFKEPILSQDMLTIENVISSSLKIENIRGIQVFTVDNEIVLARGDSPEIIPLDHAEDYFLWKGSDPDDSGDNDFISFIGRLVSNDIALGYVVVSFDRGIIEEAKRSSQLAIIGSTFLMMMIGLLSAYFLSKLVTKPIYKLIKASRAIACGDFETRFDKKYNDELGVLSDSLN